MWKVYNDAGLNAYQLGRPAEAEKLLLRAVQETDQLEEFDPRRATCLNNLASVYRVEGKFDQAEPLYVETLAILERAMGPEHLAVATALNNLADLYRVQERLAEAEPLYRRALAIKEEFLQGHHPSLATTLNNLAPCPFARRRWALTTARPSRPSAAWPSSTTAAATTRRPSVSTGRYWKRASVSSELTTRP
jgi:tetratricopeptide (TPR) repeat protein